MSAPVIQGWCPGAHRPMMSGDGLVVRVRPRLARLTRTQVLGLCAAALRHGNGTIDLTNRANLQLRGVAVEAHEPLLDDLAALDLLDAEPGIETRRNILVTPLYRSDDLTARLTRSLLDRLGDLPGLPVKFGFAIDTGPARLLADNSADIRLERGKDHALILRADGAHTGRVVSEDTAIDAMIDLAHWFSANASPEARRMARLVQTLALPNPWTGAKPAAIGDALQPGVTPLGMLIGAPFGQLSAQTLADLIRDTGATAMRVTPWRLVLLEGVEAVNTTDFITTPNDPLLNVDACTGAPLCPQAQVETRTIARRLAPHINGTLHVSGCAKGCARATAATITLVGRDGRFDLVKNGRAGDEPALRDLTPDSVSASALKTLLNMTDLT